MPVSHRTPNDYHNFDLLITRAGDTYRAYVIDAPGGDANATFTVPFPPQEIGRLNRGTGTRRHLRPGEETVIASSSTLRELGSRLYDAVFRDEVRSVLVASQTVAQAEGRALRIRLRFSGDAVDLATLPWEILFDPEQQHFLALSEARPILRYLSLPRSRPPLKVEPPLAILAVLASPVGHPHLEVEQEWQAIETALAALCADGKVTLERLARPTFDALRTRLLGEPVHVLHFVGHGLYDAAQGEGALLFEDARHQGHLIPARSLASLLHNHSSLRLVYLNACEGAIADQGNVFAGVAQTLVQQGVPAAVAMQDEITDAAAVETARTFYTALATGRPVDAALTQARVALAAQENDEWAIPVLFSRSPDNRLFDLVDVLPTPDCPYPGMRPFAEGQQELFFGRDREINEAVNRLAQHPFLSVVGPSGSGKSSLVYAGIIPALKRSRRFGAGDWAVKLIRPSDSRTADGKAAPMQALTQLLGPSLQSLVSSLQSPTLLFIDQFEEVFTLADADEAEKFLQAIHVLIKTSNLYILLTVRADFYPEMMAMGPLWEAVKANRLELTPLGDDELWAAIVEPAATMGVTVDEALVVELIHDAAKEAGVLPLVQETLVLLWEKVTSRQLKLKAYQAMADGGRRGIQVAIDRWANVVYHNLPGDAQPIARRTFLRLIQFGAGRADTRRQQTVAELRSGADNPIRFDKTLFCLVDSRLLTTSGKEGDINRRVDISHEALITGWSLLQHWIEEKREAESIRRRLEEKATDWVNSGKRSGLLNAFDLQDAERWRTGSDAAELGVSPALVAFIDQSAAALHAQARGRRRNQLLFLTAALTIIGLIIGALFINNRGQQARLVIQATAATQQAIDAQELADRATAVATAVVAAQANEAKAMRQEATAVAAAATAVWNETLAETQSRRALAENLAMQSQLLIRAENRPGDLALILARDAVLTDRTVNTDRALRFALDTARWQRTITPANQLHQGAVNVVAFHPSGELIISGGADGTVRLWNAHTGEQLVQFDGHTEGVKAVAFSPDGEIIASGSDDNSVRLWNAHTGEQLVQFDGHTRGVYAVAFSPDGAHIISGSADGTIRLWNAESGEQFVELDNYQAFDVSSMAFSLDGAHIVSGSSDATVWLGDTESGEQLAHLGDHVLPYNRSILSVVFSPDGAHIVSGGADGTVRLWNAHTGEQLVQFDGHTEGVKAVAFSPDGEIIASGSDDNSVRLWDAHTGEQLVQFDGHTEGVNAVAFSPDSEHIISGSADGTIRLWDMANADGTVRLWGANSDKRDFNEEGPCAVTFSPDGEIIASGSYFDPVRLWDATSGEQLAQLGHVERPYKAGILSVAFSPDGERIATSIGTIWDVTSGEKLTQLDSGLVFSMAFSPDGERIATSGSDAMVRLWDATSGEQLVQLDGHMGWVIALAFSPDGAHIASSSEDGTVRLWDATSGKQLVQRDVHREWIHPIVFSPDGKHIISRSDDGTVWLGDATSGEQLAQLGDGGRLDPRLSVVFSPDGEFIGLSYDGMVQIWDAESGEQLAQLDGQTGSVCAMAFSSDGARIASRSEDGTVLLWDSTQRVLLQAIVRTSRPIPILADIERQQFGIGSDVALPDQETLEPLVEQAQALQLVKQGRELARTGIITEAIAYFDRALALDPTLAIEPEILARRILRNQMQSRLFLGYSLAQDGNLAEAIAIFKEVVVFDNALNLNLLISEAKQLAAPTIFDEAVTKYKQALASDPFVGTDSEAETERLARQLITYGQTITSTVEADQVEIWLFDGDASDIITIVQQAIGDSELDTFLVLFGPDGEAIAYNDDFEGTDSQINAFVLPASATYVIVAGGLGDSSGQYRLALTVAGANR